jgi:hypothetical protein
VSLTVKSIIIKPQAEEYCGGEIGGRGGSTGLVGVVPATHPKVRLSAAAYHAQTKVSVVDVTVRRL